MMTGKMHRMINAGVTTHGAQRASRVLRVFVSSTFHDMQAERDELIKHVALTLRAACERRGVSFGFVDLRWGITEEESNRGEVLPICLAEIEHCRPYFIGLLGDRYGWVPDAIPAEVMQREPWLPEHAGCSVTEIEALAGALRNPTPDAAFFYLRAPGDRQLDARLNRLRERIRASGLTVHDYEAVGDFGRQVLADMTALVERLYPASEIVDPLTRAAADHATFARRLTTLYEGRDADLEQLDAHIEGDGPPLVLIGESGIGKSALLANWADRRRRSKPDELLLEHYLGASSESAGWAPLTVRIMSELKRRLELSREIPEERHQLRPAFAEFLYAAGDKQRVVLIIDGLDKLEDEDNAPDLLWLPSILPTGVRVLLSTLPGRSLIELRNRQWPTFGLAALASAARRSLAVSYLDRYRKRLSEPRLARIVDADQSASPLYLRALLEELRVFGEHNRLDDRIEHYLQSQANVDLYALVLARWEADYERGRPHLVRDSLSLIWAARRGIRETELLELLGEGTARPLPHAHWSPLRLAAESNVVDRDGLLGLPEGPFRMAVERRYLAGEGAGYAAHLRLADYFELRADDVRKAEELLWQLSRAQAWDRLADCLGDLELLALACVESSLEVSRYWDEIEKHTERRRAEAYRVVIESPRDHLGMMRDVSALLMNGGAHNEARRMLSAAQAHCAQTGDTALEAELARFEFKVERNRRFHDREFKLAKIPSAPLEHQIELLRGLDQPKALIDALRSLAENKIDYATGFQGAEARAIIMQSLALLREAERIALDSGRVYDRVLALLLQAETYKGLGDCHAAFHLHDLAYAIALRSLDKDALADAASQRGDLLLMIGATEDADRSYEAGFELLRQLASLESLAKRMTTAASNYIRYTVDAPHCEKALALREEARRMHRIVGNWDPMLNPARDEIIRLICQQRREGPQADPPGAAFEGPSWGWWMVPAERVKACAASLKTCFRTLGGAGVIERLEVEFAAGLHYVLGTLGRDLPARRPEWSVRLIEALKRGFPDASGLPDESTLVDAVAATLQGVVPGLHVLNDDLARDYGPYRYSSAEDHVALIFSIGLLAWPGIAERFAGRELDMLDIYPGGWEAWGAKGLKHLRAKAIELSEFYGRALNKGMTVICGPSGPALSQYIDTFEETLPLSPQGWFEGRSGRDREIECKCRDCGHEFTFDPLQGERPPPRCPVCRNR
jgi:hypothetical protein